MSRRVFTAIAALLLVVGAMVAAPIVAAGDPCFHSLSRPAPTTGATVSITIRDCDFAPTVSYIPVGSEVTWRNASSQAHEVAGANLVWGAHKKMLQPGDSIGWTFDAPGVYPYSCMLHPGMTGALVVGDGLATSAVSRPADAVAASSTDATDAGPAIGLPAAVAAGTVVTAAAMALLLLRRRPSAA